MAFLSFIGKHREEVSLLIDIGNGSITGSLVVFKKGARPEFLYALEVPFTVRDAPSALKLIEDMTGLLNDLLENIMKQGFKHSYWTNKDKKIQKSLVTFSSPWFISKTKHLELTRDNTFVITQSFIDSFVKKEEDLFMEELNRGEDKGVFEVVEKSVVHTKINGYSLEHSIGKKTKNLDAFLYISVISKEVVDIVESMILKITHTPKEGMIVHTFPLISFTVFRDMFSGSSDFLIMDITGEVTDLTLVHDDVIQKSVSIPSGRNFLIRQIMKAFNTNSEIAESTLHLYATEKLDAEGVMKMDEVLVNVEKEWSIYLENGLTELSPQMILPGNIYLTVDRDVAPIYIHFLKLSKTDTTAMFRKGVNILHIDATATEGFYTANKTVRVNEFVSLLAIFYNKIFQNSF